MRSILIFVLVVAVALGAYKFFAATPDKPITTTQQTGPNYPKPSVPRPQTGKASVEEMQVGPPTPAEAGAYTWRDTVSVDYVVKMEEAWDVDLSGVDLNADLLCTVDGVPITQTDLRTWSSLKRGQALINSAYFVALGKQAAAETGRDYGMSDAHWKIYFGEWLKQMGADPEYTMAVQALQMKVPTEAVEQIRRDTVEALLAMFPPVESADELPLNIGQFYTSEDEMQQAATMGNLMQDIVAQMFTEHGRERVAIPALVDPMSILFAKVSTSMRFRRAWDANYAEMPEGALAAIFLGEMPDDSILPPWEYEGDRHLVMLDEVWGKLSPALRDEGLRDDLREVIWNKVLRAHLRESGNLPSDREVWMQFASEYLGSEMTWFNVDMNLVDEGYPNRSIYVADQAIEMGFERSMPEDWMSEENLRAYFDKNTFFITGWQPELEMALFTPFDPEVGLTGAPNWGKALAEANALLARVEAGEEFSTLREQHNKALIQSYRDVRQDLGDGIAAELGTGRKRDSIAAINEVMRQSIWADRLAGVNPLHNAIVRLGPGEISPPWKTPVGYVIFRMNSAELGRLEREYDDVIDVTKYRYKSWKLRRWITDQLGGIKVQLP
jgi:hypothetical protein